MTSALLGANLVGSVVGVGLSITSSVMQQEVNSLLSEVNQLVEQYMNYYNYNVNAYNLSITFKSFMDKYVAYLVYVQYVDMQALTPETFLPSSSLPVGIIGDVFSLVSQVAMSYALYRSLKVPKVKKEDVAQTAEEVATTTSARAAESKGLMTKTKSFLKNPLNIALLSQSVATVMNITNLSIAIDSMRTEIHKLEEKKTHLENELIPNALDLNIRFHKQMDAATRQLYALGQLLANEKVSTLEKDFASNLAIVDTTLELMWKTDLLEFTTHVINGLLHFHTVVNKKTPDTLVAWFEDMIQFKATDTLMIDMGNFFYEYDISALTYDEETNQSGYNQGEKKPAMKISNQLYQFFSQNVYKKPDGSLFDATNKYIFRARAYYGGNKIQNEKGEVFPRLDSKGLIDAKDILCMHILFFTNFIDKVDLNMYSGDHFIPDTTIDPDSV